MTTRYSGMATDINTFLSAANDIHPQTASGWKLSGVYRHPLGKDFTASANIGVFAWQADYSLSTTAVERNVTSHGVDGLFGVGVEYQVYPETSLHVDYEVLDIDGENLSVFSLGGGY